MVFNKYGAIYMIISLGLKKSKTKLFKIKGIVPKKNRFCPPFFFLLRTMTDIEYSFVRLHKVSWQLWCKL